MKELFKLITLSDFKSDVGKKAVAEPKTTASSLASLFSSASSKSDTIPSVEPKPKNNSLDKLGKLL